MNMDFSLQMTQEQKLIMTQQMQLSIKILQMSNVDLLEYINNEFAENPILDANYSNKKEEALIKDKYDYKEMVKYFESDNYTSQSYSSYNEDEISPFNFISSKKTLKEYLYEQIGVLKKDKNIKLICCYFIENIDRRGYLPINIENLCSEICVTLEEGEEALKIIQTLDPIGIGARDIKECLKIQINHEKIYDENLIRIIDDNLDDLAENKYIKIAKNLNITPHKVQQYADIIKKLEPKPSRGFYTGDEVKFVIPDAEIKKIDNQYFIIMNDGVIPNLSINPIYKEILNQDKDKEALEYIKDKMGSAMFLIKSIAQRKNTLYRVLECILNNQKEYFKKGLNYLKPMTLKEIADALEVHESTVSRAIRDKYILTAMGTIKIKDLFTTGIQNNENLKEDISVINIKNKIKDLIDKENKNKPFSDQLICEKLNKENMNISRRTVAKYREEMEIKSSSKRKRF